MRAVLLETATWKEAEQFLGEETVVVIPLGAVCKEHGYHLPLNNDWLMAEYLKQRVLAEVEDVVVAPTIGHHFYPAFVEYPGSITLRLDTARDLIVDVCSSLFRYGPRKFYVLNTGISTVRALEPAQEALLSQGIALRFCNLHEIFEQVRHLQEQEGGGHADEVETSIMLHIAPDVVQMDKAVKEFHPGKGRLTRDPENSDAVLSHSGVWGDATLASADKGRDFTEALVREIFAGIKELKLLGMTGDG
ncbi:MAG: creatininase family protein [Terriglobales bacterium]